MIPDLSGRLLRLPPQSQLLLAPGGHLKPKGSQWLYSPSQGALGWTLELDTN